MQLLERRKALLALVRHALDAPKIWLSIGTENEAPELRSLSVVASGYGLANRRLGAVSVMGPVRMDYAQAITSVRQAAAELSRFVEDIYEE
jgi:heat-inducible transcriptional repressor